MIEGAWFRKWVLRRVWKVQIRLELFWRWCSPKFRFELIVSSGAKIKNAGRMPALPRRDFP
jgi:hypothetical protein